MKDVLHAIYECRMLAAKCKLGVELSLDEIDKLSFAERSLQLASADQNAEIRHRGNSYFARLSEFGPRGATCDHFPRLDREAIIEIVIEDFGFVYRFKAKVRSTKQLGAHSTSAYLAFVGAPLLVRIGCLPTSSDQPVIDLSAA